MIHNILVTTYLFKKVFGWQLQNRTDKELLKLQKTKETREILSCIFRSPKLPRKGSDNFGNDGNLPKSSPGQRLMSGVVQTANKVSA